MESLGSPLIIERIDLMKSFIAWIGGKSLLAKKIIAEFPTNLDRYVEVFGGGGSVLFAKDSHAPLEVYNDANSEYYISCNIKEVTMVKKRKMLKCTFLLFFTYWLLCRVSLKLFLLLSFSSYIF